MDLWVVWIIAAAALAAGETATLGFFLAPFAGGALLAAVAAVVGVSPGVSIAVFLVASVLALGFLRPIARRHTRTPPAIRTGTAALVGRRALVLEDVTPDGGSVKLEGEVWTARPYVEDDVIAAGTRVQVVDIKGATALVSE